MPELSEHARSRAVESATPHSQRLSRDIGGGEWSGRRFFGIDLIWFPCAAAVPTETQVMVKREDEQAFAELNVANPTFRRGRAARLPERLLADERIGDFRVVASHQESLHSHDAVSILTEGPTLRIPESIDPRLFASLHKAG